MASVRVSRAVRAMVLALCGVAAGQSAPVGASAQSPSPKGDPEKVAGMQKFAAAQMQCVGDLKERQRAAADSCQEAATLADTLPDGLSVQRVTAYRQAGEAYLRVGAKRDALRYYGLELTTAKAKLDPSNALLAAAYRDMATAHFATGATQQSDVEMGLAERTLEAARQRTDTGVSDEQYRRAMKVLLTEHAAIASKLGDAGRAAELGKRAEGMR